MSRNWRAEDVIEIGELEVEARQGSDQPRTARILVETTDEPGVLAQVAKAIADCQVNISECLVNTTDDERAHINFGLEITERKQLEEAVSTIAGLETVINVRQIVTGHRRVAIVARTGIDEDGQRWAELRNGEIVYPDSTPYRNLSIEAEELAPRR